MLRRANPTPSRTGERGYAPKTPIETPPPDKSQLDAWYDGEDAIIMLREYEADPEFELSLDTKSWRLGGSRECEICLPERGLSAVHCLLERHGLHFLVHDLDSSYGTIHEGRRIYGATYITPGDRFTAVPVRFIALNQEMREQRPLLVDLLGSDRRPWSADRLMVEATKGLGHLLLTGEPGCEHHRLACAIHAMSLVRKRKPVDCTTIPPDRADQVALIQRARQSTMVLKVTEQTQRLDPTFCSMLFSSDSHVRVIVIAPTPSGARRVLPSDHLDQMQHVWIRPIGVRVGELPVIFDRLLSERDPSLRFANLTESNRARLLAREWRRNWEELRITWDRLVGIARMAESDWRGRAAALGMKKTTLHEWYFKTMKLDLPLLE